jgi:acetyl esterase/lipase
MSNAHRRSNIHQFAFRSFGYLKVVPSLVIVATSWLVMTHTSDDQTVAADGPMYQALPSNVFDRSDESQVVVEVNPRIRSVVPLMFGVPDTDKIAVDHENVSEVRESLTPTSDIEPVEPNPIADTFGRVPNAQPGDTVPHGAGIAASTVTKNLSYGPLEQHTFDLYLPNHRSITPAPVIVFVHGGAWIFGTKEEGMNLAGPIDNMLNKGWAVAAISYRLAGSTSNHPDALHDVKRAIRWMKVNATTHGLDPDTVVVSGHSAGGHLALLAGLTSGVMEPSFSGAMSRVTSRPDAVVALAPVVDLVHFSRLHPSHPEQIFQRSVAAYFGCPITHPICDLAANHMANPLNHLDPSDPPVYLAHGDTDWVVPINEHSITAHDRMHPIIGVNRVWLDVIEGSNHDYLGANATMIADFLSKVRAKTI